ncbi:TRAF family member-associated NF-kappa-B activator-like [Stegostoma tigrinum]|uniref:TRAF family member-associated NF-kappa-B activator-like n=1 Tax=Stegostoma tigrinum TaxID=3053191 RepID=UPI00202B9056|nr:TRAF family member-associated NF-kappa-B activator-like [Stegostoma tigrinum]XP_048389685.1 TRAF family member-associated NF-kappa-B activator-like [Stegostoma tigrinum]XP_048389686.1 TRAF family member-associated NF-kappa-B activator-like [Stegostoma tigrinum]XP_048389687.1 TRAF family member-associated NF-kappa-B activator-like [Stegostoma tigrinum]XP_048389688.1 TRAF family member-associated NF-kappa-B activator-like [Stegostoma tigrinum]XP_048389689.1 TRAF family member-associated NF-ka
MDKNNLGDQLNRAFEAYRQACMERDNMKKISEQKIYDLEQELATKDQTIAKLQLQSASTTPRGNNPGQAQCLNPWPQSDLLKVRRNEAQHPVTYDSPDELKVALERERHCKEQLTTENSKLEEQIKDYQQKQKELKRSLEEKDEELRQLRNELMEHSEFFTHGQQVYCRPDSKVNWKMAESSSKNAVPLTGTEHPLYKERLDFAFQEICQEFKQLSALTKKQTELLSKYNYSKEVINMPFSMPIQCTDEGEQEHAEEHFVGKDKNISKTSAALQGYGMQQELLQVVESLSELDVRFPPSDSDYDFLNSAPEKTISKTPFEDPICKIEGALLQGDIQDLKDKNREQCTLFETFPVGPTNKTKPNHFGDEQGKTANVNASVGTAIDNSTLRSPSSPSFLKPSKPFPSAESHQIVSTEPTVIRGPQHPVWYPYHNKEGELLHQASKDSDPDLNSKTCEFCQAVFPAGTITKEEFLRHLNSHFIAKNGF